MPTDLFECFEAWFKADATLAGLFPNGVMSRYAPAGRTYPYCRYVGRDLGRPMSVEDRQFSLTYSVFALSDDDAKAYGTTILTRLAATTRAAFAWVEGGATVWTDCGFVPDGPGDLIPMPPAGGKGTPSAQGLPVWRYDVTTKWNAVAVP